MNAHRPLFKVISATIAFIFFTTQIGWTQDQQYIPFNENQDQSQYLAPEQLQRFSDIKNTLVDQHNATSSPPLQTEEEIITFLYNTISPDDFANLTQLENAYNASVAEKETAWQDFVDQKGLLEDYYKQLDYLSSSLDSINLQIGSVNQQISTVEQDKEETQNSIQSLETQLTSKNASAQNKLLEASALESNISTLKDALSQLDDEKVVRKNDLDDAEALFNEKTAQKEALETELDTILSDLNAKWEEVENTTDPVEKAQKEAEYAALQILYDDKLASYNSFMPEYTAAEQSYQIALSAYENKISAIEATQNEITQNETDLLSDYEAIKLLEHDINALNEEKATETLHYNYLGSALGTLNDSLNKLTNKKTELETVYGIALNTIEQQLEETGTNDKLQQFKATVEGEKRARSLYESALEARNQLVSSLKYQDKKLQSVLLATILEVSINMQQDGTQGDVLYEVGGQAIVLTEEEINNILLAMDEGLVLAGGKAASEAIRKTEAARRSLRENYSKVFGREPTEQMLNAFVDIISRAKMPAIRLFEILKRINDKNLKATEDERLEVEDSALDPGDIAQALQDNLLYSIIKRLQDKSASSEMIKGAISYLTTLPLPLVSCGVIALGGLFEQIGKSASESKIAEEAILTDILAGSINKDTTGQLQLSLYALKKAAEASGETLYGRKLSADDLENATSPFIAHVNGNHYVLVRKIENGMVTYFDPDPGMDLATSVKDFGRSFTGFALTTNDKDGGAALQDDEMKNVFGAGWFSRARRAVRRTVSRVSKAVKSVAKSVSKTVKKVSKTVSKTVKSVAKSVSKTVKKVSKTVSKAVSSAKKSVSKAVSSVSKSVKKTVTKVVNAVSEAASKAKDVIVSTVEKAKKTAATVSAAVSNYVSEKAEQARNFVSEKVNQARTFITDKINQGKTYIANKVEAAKKFISEKAEAAKEYISEQVEAAKEFASNKADELKSYASTKLDEAKDAFDSYMESVSSGMILSVSAASDLEFSDQELMSMDDTGELWSKYLVTAFFPFSPDFICPEKPEDAKPTDTFLERASIRLQQAAYYLLTPKGQYEASDMIGNAIYNWITDVPDRFVERYNEWPRTNNLGVPQVLINALAVLDGAIYSVGGHAIEGIISNTAEKYNARTDMLMSSGAHPAYAHFYGAWFGVMDFIGVAKIAEAITGTDSVTFDDLTGGDRFDRGTIGVVQTGLTVVAASKLLTPAAAGTKVTYTTTVGGQSFQVVHTPVTYTITGNTASASWTIAAGEGAGYLGASQGLNFLDDFAINYADDMVTYNGISGLGDDFVTTFGDDGVTYTNIFGTTGSANIEMVSPSTLVGRQVRSEFSGSNIKRFKKDMIKNGWNGPPIEVHEVDGVKIILDGHHRTRAAGAAGLDEIPVRTLTEQELWSKWGLTPGALQAQADEALFERTLALPR